MFTIITLLLASTTSKQKRSFQLGVSYHLSVTRKGSLRSLWWLSNKYPVLWPLLRWHCQGLVSSSRHELRWQSLLTRKLVELLDHTETRGRYGACQASEKEILAEDGVSDLGDGACALLAPRTCKETLLRNQGEVFFMDIHMQNWVCKWLCGGS